MGTSNYPSSFNFNIKYRRVSYLLLTGCRTPISISMIYGTRKFNTQQSLKVAGGGKFHSEELIRFLMRGSFSSVTVIF